MIAILATSRHAAYGTVVRTECTFLPYFEGKFEFSARSGGKYWSDLVSEQYYEFYNGTGREEVKAIKSMVCIKKGLVRSGGDFSSVSTFPPKLVRLLFIWTVLDIGLQDIHK